MCFQFTFVDPWIRFNFFKRLAVNTSEFRFAKPELGRGGDLTGGRDDDGRARAASGGGGGAGGRGQAEDAGQAGGGTAVVADASAHTHATPLDARTTPHDASRGRRGCGAVPVPGAGVLAGVDLGGLTCDRRLGVLDASGRDASDEGEGDDEELHFLVFSHNTQKEIYFLVHKC